MSSLGDLGVNLVASVIAGLAVWLAQRIRRQRREGRKRRFFGISPGNDALISVPRHATSRSPDSVHRVDVAALVEVAAIVRDCGSQVELLVQGDIQVLQRPLGDKSEFCIGGPDANTRMGVHLETFLPGVRTESYAEAGHAVPIHVGDNSFVRTPDIMEYVLLAKIATQRFPVFLICGQAAITNRAAAIYLSRNYDGLVSTYGTDGNFCIVLKIEHSRHYGAGKVESVGDFTSIAFSKDKRQEHNEQIF